MARRSRLAAAAADRVIVRVVWRSARRGDFGTALVVAVAVATALLLAPIAIKLTQFLPECNFHRWTGWACPSCGATRAVAGVARGDLRSALSWNPLVALAASGMALAGLAAPIVLLVARRVPVLAGKVPAVAWWLLAAAVLANWAYLVATGV